MLPQNRRGFLKATSGAAGATALGLFCPQRVSAQESFSSRIFVEPDKIIRPIPRELYGTTIEWRNGGSGLWRQDLDGFDPDVIRLSEDLKPGLVRFPGGLLTDFYHWEGGIGPRSERGVAEPWPEGPLSTNSLGTDEMLEFARLAGGKLLVSVNAGTGTPEEAGRWVRHINGSSPGQVKYWEVGNELYNTGGFAALYVTVRPEVYAERFLYFAREMRREDPTIKIGAIGGENFGRYILVDYPAWTPILLTAAGEEIDFISVHNAFSPVNLFDQDLDVRTVYTGMLASPQAIRRNLRTLGIEIDILVPHRRSNIRIGISEWGPLFQFEPSPYVLHVRTLGSALYIASTLKQFIDSPRVNLSCTFNLLSDGFIGWIGKRDDSWIPNAQYLALQMFTRHFGYWRVLSYYGSPSFDSTLVGIFEPETKVPTLDVLVSLDEERRTLFLMVINKHFDLPADAVIDLGSFRPAGHGTAWMLNGTGIDANTGTAIGDWGVPAQDEKNPRFLLGDPTEVAISSQPVYGIRKEFRYRFPAHSITSIEIPGRL